jgi:guanosine-3',5'-bis(diphosphate) 3'-pyrophosphohydrolase
MSDFCVVGSGPLAIREIRDTKDLDVIVTNRLWNDLLGKYASEVENGVERIKFKNNIEILNPIQSMFGNSGIVPMEEIFEKADVIDEVKFINLDHLKKIKLKMGREKDLADIKLIDEYLKNRIEFAKEFAIKKFKEAGRGNHWPDVLAVLQEEFNVDDPEILAAAILHDTLEDTETTYEELEQNFSKTIANLVQEVSHPKNYKGEQVLEYYRHLNHISPKAKIIKLADFTANLRGITKIRQSEPEKPYHDQYIQLIRKFLEHCPDSKEKDLVFELTNELEKYVTEKYNFDK